MKQYSPLFFSLFLLCALSFTAVAAPDYGEASSWLSQPSAPEKPVDVFFVYPTIYAEETPKNMDIKRADLKARAQHALDSQASVFGKSTNLFAPLYRQMSMAALDPDQDMYKNQYFKIGAGDIDRAFDYYLTTLNPDRPFILAGHSQGSMVLIDLMRKRFKDPALQKRLVAAYLIGYSLLAEDLKQYPWMKLAQGAEDTGVIISYNTQAPTAVDSPVLLPGAVSINPLTWSSSTDPADKSLNLGAVFYEDSTNVVKREVAHYVGAQIDAKTSALFASPPDTLDVGSFPAGVYHVYDYALWYRNLEANIALRVKRYLEK